MPVGKPNHRRRLAGSRAKAWGSFFEDAFATKCRFSAMAITRIPDSCRQISAQRMIRVKSPFDWIVSFDGKSLVIDTKTTMANAFGFSQIDPDQVRELLHHERAHVLAGYVVWLRGVDQVIFVPASLLAAAIGEEGSFKQDSPGVWRLGSSLEFDLRKIFAIRANDTGIALTPLLV